MDSFLKILKNIDKVDKKEIVNLENFINQDNKALFNFIISNNLIDFEVISKILLEKYSLQTITLSDDIIDSNALGLLSYDICIKNNILPLNTVGNEFTLVMANPFDYSVIENVELITSKVVKVLFTNCDKIKLFISSCYTNSNIDNISSTFIPSKEEKTLNYDEHLSVNNAPAVKIVNQMLDKSIFMNTSDIHLEPQETCLRVRYRIDGELVLQQEIDINLIQLIVSRIKVMSNMDIYEKRLPQDGRFKKTVNNFKVDFRVSSIPTIFGEKIVIRLIYNKFDVDKLSLGFSDVELKEFYSLLKRRQGAILITGPTGSGKSTTLSSFIKYMNKDNINIVTIEDPVENIIKGINQINISSKNGFDFADALRFILRQDPDVIMVGEIRDSATAKLVIRAAMTGHLVLSTLHTSDSIAAISRLIDMKIDDYLVLDNIKGVVSQRLIRKLCHNCKEEILINHGDAKVFKLDKNTKVFINIGCSLCNNTGFIGRFLVSETLIVNDTFKSLVQDKLSSNDIKVKLKATGMKFLYDNALENVLNGNTTIDEIYKFIF